MTRSFLDKLLGRGPIPNSIIADKDTPSTNGIVDDNKQANTDKRLADKLDRVITKLEDKLDINWYGIQEHTLYYKSLGFINYAILVDDTVTFEDCKVLLENYDNDKFINGFRRKTHILKCLVLMSCYTSGSNDVTFRIWENDAESYAYDHNLSEVDLIDDDKDCIKYYDHDDDFKVKAPDFIDVVKTTENFHKLEVILDTLDNSYDTMSEDFDKQNSALYNAFMNSFNEMIHDYLKVAVPYTKANYLNKKQYYLNHRDKVSEKAQAILDDLNLGS